MEAKSILRPPFGSEYAESTRWNPFERLYIQLFGQVDLPTRMRARLVIKALRDVPWNTMLDLGSGAGAYSLYFSRSPEAHVWGLDIEKSRISDCIALSRKLERRSLDFVCCASIFETGLIQPDSIDVVLAVEVLQYLPDVRAGLREIQRVLKTGGYFIGHFPMLGYRRKYETILFDTENLVNFVREAGLEPVSVARIFGRTPCLLCQLFSCFGHSKFLTALTFPLLLLASLFCGGESSSGIHCMVVARKTLSDAVSQA
jgi:SAM-dependent methyltransferase